jgi:hypothetical protein
MVLILRTQAAQDRLQGRPNSIFGENDYAVCEDRRIGRIYFAIHVSGPEKWAWLVPGQYQGLEVPVQRSDYAVSLEAAKAELAEQYRRWQASSPLAGHQQGPATGQGPSSGRG